MNGQTDFLIDSPLDRSAVISVWDDDTWLTPRWILNALGTFDLDPCAAMGIPNWVCDKSYTIESDGLRNPWNTGRRFQRVFLNPPFSCIEPWVRRMAEHGNGIALLPAGHDTAAWARWVWPHAKALFFLRGRVRFVGADGSVTRGRPRCAIALAAYGDSNVEVLRRFPGAGVFMEGWVCR